MFRSVHVRRRLYMMGMGIVSESNKTLQGKGHHKWDYHDLHWELP
jgi:hypothetical protein